MNKNITCEKCGNKFTEISYKSHQKRKTSCENDRHPDFELINFRTWGKISADFAIKTINNEKNEKNNNCGEIIDKDLDKLKRENYHFIKSNININELKKNFQLLEYSSIKKNKNIGPKQLINLYISMKNNNRFNGEELLNRDVWGIIFGYCELKEIKKLSKICKYFNEIFKSNKYVYFLSKENKITLFKQACINNKLDVIKVLIIHEYIDPSYDNNFAINCASEYGHEELLKMLLEQSLKNNRINPHMCVDKALYKHYRSQVPKNLPKIIMILLEHSKKDARIDLSISDNELLRKVCEFKKNDNILEILLNQSLNNKLINPGAHYNQAIVKVCAYGNIKKLKMLLEYSTKYGRINPGDCSNVALTNACECGNIEIVEILLNHSEIDKRINPSDDDNAPIRYACSNGHIEIVKMLLNYSKNDIQVDPTALRNYALRTAINRSNEKIINLLSDDYRFNPSIDNNSVIMAAIYRNKIEFVKKSLKNSKVDIGLRNNEILYESCKQNSKELVEILLNDDRVNPSDCHNRCLILVIKYNYVEIIELLMNHNRINLDINSDKLINLANDKGYYEIASRIEKDPKHCWFENIKKVNNEYTNVIRPTDGVCEIRSYNYGHDCGINRIVYLITYCEICKKISEKVSIFYNKRNLSMICEYDQKIHNLRGTYYINNKKYKLCNYHVANGWVLNGEKILPMKGISKNY